MSDTIKLRLWEVGGTPAAYLFSTTPKEGRDGKQVWVPRSQIEHITRQPPEVNQWRECEVTVPEWLADKKGLL